MLRILPQKFANAICDTLIGSLWLGILLAAAAAIIILCTRHSTARLRYALLLTTLCMFGSAVLFIFFRQLIAYMAPQPSFTVVLDHPITTTFINKQGGDNYSTLINMLRNNANMIVVIWSLIVLARIIQLLTGLQGLYLLRNRHVFVLHNEWEKRMMQLAAQLGIKRAIRIAESGIGRGPM